MPDQQRTLSAEIERLLGGASKSDLDPLSAMASKVMLASAAQHVAEPVSVHRIGFQEPGAQAESERLDYSARRVVPMVTALLAEAATEPTHR